MGFNEAPERCLITFSPENCIIKYFALSYFEIECLLVDLMHCIHIV